MAISALRVSQDRLWASLLAMARIGATSAGGCNRQALTDLDRQGRDLFCDWARNLGCDIEIDQVGNIFARRPGLNPSAEPVLMGSHLDTQATGGKFDGVYGVLAGLEVLRAFEDAGVRTQHPLEVAVWTNEEGCRFTPAMLGSGVVSGVYGLDEAYAAKDKHGHTFKDELERIGYLGSMPAKARKFRAMFEVHIEQGPILEAEGKTIGIVTGIQGAYWFDLELRGAAVHAGPTPMEMRQDPWRALAPIIADLYRLVESNGPSARVTFGDVRAEPGARNTVPSTLTVSVDLRHPDAATLEAMNAEFRALVSRYAAAARVDDHIEQVWHMPATRFDEGLVADITASAASLGLSAMRIVSGAGHDSLHTAQFAPTAMIFVPCEGGISHNEIENATPEDLAAGANVLLHAVIAAAC